MSVIISIVIGCILIGGATVSSTPDSHQQREDGVAGDEIITDNQAPLPTRDQLLSMLDSMAGLTNEDKESLRKDLLSDFRDEVRPVVGKGNLQTQQTLLLFSLLGLLALVFLFFGYKLYKSLTDRERQRNAKKRIKERRNKVK